MNGILIAAHGSRRKNTEDTLNEVVSMVKAKLPDHKIEIGYMEFCEMTIEKGLSSLVEQGANKIKVVPYFLFEGIHISEDIPGELEKFKEHNPGVEITFGSTLGADPRLADILVDRILN